MRRPGRGGVDPRGGRGRPGRCHRHQGPPRRHRRRRHARDRAGRCRPRSRHLGADGGRRPRGPRRLRRARPQRGHRAGRGGVGAADGAGAPRACRGSAPRRRRAGGRRRDHPARRPLTVVPTDGSSEPVPADGPVLAVLGPTASGKSAVALEVARRRTAAGSPTELVAVDAFTVYRGMDVGTAKPSVADREDVRHHLVDVLDPWEELSVAAFRDLARAAVDDVRSRGATPLLVGGSGLYWRATVDPLRFPPTDAEVRARLEARWVDDPAGAHSHLAGLDPAAAARIGPGNLRRTVRALEVLELTGERFSAFDDAWQHFDRAVYPALEVALLDPDTDVLRARIEARAEAMVADGLLEEAAALRSLPRPLSRTARQGIGYAEAFAVLDGQLAADELASTIAKRTWRYARRQRAWFRADPRCVPADAAALPERWQGRTP
ncbi:tRNA (adenosine(37)-N6)-dimethylallyltransferase MiaA [Nitriliruptoraceae bacterium ZYF776]|nr:tRNA (adenosine(37)-N6)-dimethylallyltransferase MiaA [Profundirhabdus halotolerans]